jgi:UDP-2,3-diacylglucosamine pyrophosphatase LpxH
VSEGESGGDEVMWVVSDLHLGLNVTKETKSEEIRHSNHEKFAEFLNYSISNDTFEVKSNRTFSRPTKLVLLGDIFELNDPYDDKFKYVAIELFESLEGLFKLSKEVLYVIGNHDEAMESYDTTDEDIDEYEIKPSEKGYFPIQNPRFRIIPRIREKNPVKYADKKDKDPRRIRVGKETYFFMHGHEFDKLQATFSIGKISGILQRINQVNKDFFPKLNLGWQKLDGAFPLILFLGTLLIYIYLYRWWPILFLSGTLSVFAISYVIPTHLNKLWGPLSRLGEKIKEFLMIKSSRNKEIVEIIEEKFYDPAKDDHKDAVTVFGHTHKPEIYIPPEKDEKKFINTGGWVDEGPKKDSKGKKIDYNTLVVIDKEGALLLRWDGKEKGFTLLNSLQ